MNVAKNNSPMKALKIKGFRNGSRRGCNFLFQKSYNQITDLETVKVISRLQKEESNFLTSTSRSFSEQEKTPEKTIRTTHWADFFSLWKSIAITELMNA